MLRFLAMSITTGVVCGGLLNVFFAAVKHQWPANYFDINASVDPLVSRNMTRYLIFRFSPPLLVFGAAAVTADNLKTSPWLAALVALIVHAAPLFGAIGQSMKRRTSYKLAAGRATIVLALTCLAFLSTAFRDLIAPLIPSPDDLVGNLWAGVIAAVGAVYLQRLALVKRDPVTIAKDCTRKLDQELIYYARQAAKRAKVDEVLVLVFMIAEDTQRPKWFRNLEYRAPGSRHRTTGIMQQHGARTDKESIDMAVSNYFAPITESVRRDESGTQPIEEIEGSINYAVLTRAAQQYNADPQFRGLVKGLYENLSDDVEWKLMVGIDTSPVERDRR